MQAINLVDDVVLRLARSGKLETLLRKPLEFTPETVKRPFRKLIEDAQMRTFYREKLVPEQELEERYRGALQLLAKLNGAAGISDYLEFGVCHGTSMLCMHRALSKENVATTRLFGFDSFDGLPDEASFDDNGLWGPRWYRSSYELTHRNLTKHGIDWRRTQLIRGWFSDTMTDEFLATNHVERASIIMVDCDMYISAKQCLTFCAPLIRDRAVIFFDDWDAAQQRLANNNLGERRAYEEFMAEHPEFVAEERPELRYRSTDPTSEAYSRVFLVTRRAAA